jgi:undecaprenyl diphosphate synthase
MDGNGRWATQRGQPRVAGHLAGARVARTLVELARNRGIRVLTLYAFSADNWRRPRREVSALMRLFRRYLLSETEQCLANGVRLTILGRRDRLSPELVHTIEGAERATAHGTVLHLRVAVDYSARDAIVRAAAMARGPEDLTREGFERLLAAADHSPPVPAVDLMIRTGGEQRLSDFLLWESAYAEFVFTPTYWPDFDANALDAALQEYARRKRRFGGLDADSLDRAATG